MGSSFLCNHCTLVLLLFQNFFRTHLIFNNRHCEQLRRERNKESRMISFPKLFFSFYASFLQARDTTFPALPLFLPTRFSSSHTHTHARARIRWDDVLQKPRKENSHSAWRFMGQEERVGKYTERAGGLFGWVEAGVASQSKTEQSRAE